MLISVNISYIKAHCSILREEQKVVEALSDCLKNQCKIACDANLVDDVIFWEKQLKILQDQRQYIQGRISLLEQMAEQFTKLNREIAECLEDASNRIKHLGALSTIFEDLL